MSTASDINAFAHPVEPAQSETIFNSKKWTYIQDSTSNTGQYSGQIQFNLSTISSQAAFVKWSEAVIELPIKLQITNGGASSITTTAAASYDQLIPKAGAWHFLDSALTEWSQDDLLNCGPTSTFVLDKFEPRVPAMDSSLENLALSKFQNIKAYDFGLSNTFINSGARERAKMTAVDPTGTKLSNSILGSTANAQAAARPQVWNAAAGTITTGAPIYVAHYIATIRPADISDYFKKWPMQKNVSGFIYLNYNSSQTTLVQNTAGVIDPAVLDSISCNMQFASTTLSITADANGTATAGTGLTPSQTFSRLLVPTYTTNPSADHALTQKKLFRYFERITNKFTVLPNASFTWTITNGIANPKKLVTMPIITSMTAGGTTADVINPFLSPLSTVPARTSPFASLKNLQVTVGNIPCFNNCR
ncbi:hypothetical protein PHPALM_28994, partial [Phytophthora palmivora]